MMRLPDVVKQIGKVSGEERVYVEDYVYTYLNELKKGVLPLRVALYGHVCHKEHRHFYFVYGAASVVDELENGKNEERIRKEYFEEFELIGYVNIYGNGQAFSGEKHALPQKQEGYYIFYEKNEAMQNYLLACYERNNRDLVHKVGKKMSFSLAETIKKLLYGECIIILALAVTTINDYHKMHDFVEVAGRAIIMTETKNR